MILMREKRNAHDVSVGKLKLTDHLKDVGRDRRVILHRISKQLVWS